MHGLRQRLDDSDAALRLHVEMANDLAEQLASFQTKEVTVVGTACQTLSADGQCCLELRSTLVEAALRALNRRACRNLCQRVLSAWRSHCEKVAMFRNMRRMAELHSSPAPESLGHLASSIELGDTSLTVSEQAPPSPPKHLQQASMSPLFPPPPMDLRRVLSTDKMHSIGLDAAPEQALAVAATTLEGSIERNPSHQLMTARRELSRVRWRLAHSKLGCRLARHRSALQSVALLQLRQLEEELAAASAATSAAAAEAAAAAAEVAAAAAAAVEASGASSQPAPPLASTLPPTLAQALLAHAVDAQQHALPPPQASGMPASGEASSRKGGNPWDDEPTPGSAAPLGAAAAAAEAVAAEMFSTSDCVIAGSGCVNIPEPRAGGGGGSEGGAGGQASGWAVEGRWANVPAYQDGKNLFEELSGLLGLWSLDLSGPVWTCLDLSRSGRTEMK